MAALIRDAVTRSGLSLTEIGRRAGVSTSTVHRVVNGHGSPSVATVTEIATACGLQLRLTAALPADPAAAGGARLLVDETYRGSSPAAVAWSERLELWHPDDPVAWMQTAAHHSGLLHRPDALYLRAVVDERRPVTIGRLASAGVASSGRWALSGAAGISLDPFGAPAPAQTVLWCEDPVRLEQLLHGAPVQRASSPRRATLILATGDEHLFDGTFTHDDTTYAAPTQIMIDCLSLGGAAAAAAAEEIARW